MRQTCRIDAGRHRRKTRPTRSAFSQVARAREPIVQKTICCRPSESATNWTSEISAWSAKTIAIPNRITVSTVAPKVRDSIRISAVATNAPAKAHSGTR